MPQATREERRNKVIEVLNQARSMELHAISQYMNHHYNLDDMDYGELAASMKLIAIDEMRHAEMFAERIKELDGEPTSDPAEKVLKGQTVEKIFPFDAGLEDNTMDIYNQYLQVCRDNGDNTSAKLFETLIDEEQLHFNYFDDVDRHIRELGDTYLSKIAGSPGSTGGFSKGFVIQGGGAGGGGGAAA